jgi:hypothetical protein
MVATPLSGCVHLAGESFTRVAPTLAAGDLIFIRLPLGIRVTNDTGPCTILACPRQAW